MRTIQIMLFALILLVLTGCEGGAWSASVMGDYETSETGVMWNPDPNGGIGIRTMSDSVIEKDTWDNIAVGIGTEFYINDMLDAVSERVIPGDWYSLSNFPIRTYGVLSMLYDIDNESWIWLSGTETRWQLTPHLEPAVRVEYRGIEGDSTNEGIVALFGMRYTF